MAFIYPRRFSEAWQMLSDYPGTLEQQALVRSTFALTYGTKKHKLFQALDKSINSVYLRSYMTFGFLPDDLWPPNLLAVAGATGINMRASIAESVIPNLALHELGHVVDKHLMTAAKRLWFMQEAGIDPNTNTWNQNVQETFADAVRDCIQNTGWQNLWPILLG